MVEAEERKIKEREEAVREQEERDKKTGKINHNKKKEHDDVWKKAESEAKGRPEPNLENKK